MIISVEAIANQQHDFFIKDKDRYLLKLEQIADEYIDKNKRVVINSGPSPQQIYFISRKGWIMDDAELSDDEVLETLIQRGADYLIIHKPSRFNNSGYPQVYEDDHFEVYRLHE